MELNRDSIPLTEAFYYILVALYGSPSHGYGIMQEVERMSLGRVTIGAGTLYTALNTLLKKKWIAGIGSGGGNDTRRKMYAITESGRQTLLAEMDRLELMIKNGRHAIRKQRGTDNGTAE